MSYSRLKAYYSPKVRLNGDDGQNWNVKDGYRVEGVPLLIPMPGVEIVNKLQVRDTTK